MTLVSFQVCFIVIVQKFHEHKALDKYVSDTILPFFYQISRLAARTHHLSTTHPSTSLVLSSNRCNVLL